MLLQHKTSPPHFLLWLLQTHKDRLIGLTDSLGSQLVPTNANLYDISPDVSCEIIRTTNDDLIEQNFTSLFLAPVVTFSLKHITNIGLHLLRPQPCFSGSCSKDPKKPRGLYVITKIVHQLDVLLILGFAILVLFVYHYISSNYLRHRCSPYIF